MTATPTLQTSDKKPEAPKITSTNPGEFLHDLTVLANGWSVSDYNPENGSDQIPDPSAIAWKSDLRKILRGVPKLFIEQATGPDATEHLFLDYTHLTSEDNSQLVRIVVEEPLLMNSRDVPEFSTAELTELWSIQDSAQRYQRLDETIRKRMENAEYLGVRAKFKLTAICDPQTGELTPMQSNRRGGGDTPWLQGFKSTHLEFTPESVPNLLGEKEYRSFHHFAVFCDLLKRMEGESALYTPGSEGQPGNSSRRLWLTPHTPDALFVFKLALRQNPRSGAPSIGIADVKFRGMTTLGFMSGGAAQSYPATEATEPERTGQQVILPSLTDDDDDFTPSGSETVAAEQGTRVF